MAYKVYSKFTGKTRDGSVWKLSIQDLPESRVEEALDFYMANLINDDPFEIAAGVVKSKEALAESRDIMMELFKKAKLYTVFCSFDNDSSDRPILGMSMVELTSKNVLEGELKDWYAKIKAKENKKLFELYGELYGNPAMMGGINNYTKDKYFDGRGVAVRPDLKDSDIATELLKTTKQLCKDHSVPMVMAWLCTVESQKAAEQAGYETICEVSFNDIASRHGVIFENNPSTSKLVIARA